MADLTIRTFQPEDRDALQDIRARAFEPVFASFRSLVNPTVAKTAFATLEQEQAALLDSFCKPDASEKLFVAETGGQPAGFVVLSLDEKSKVGEISFTAVDPDHQNGGVGTRLNTFALERMREAGMTVATVGTGGDASHAPARRAYAKAGFDQQLPTVWLYQAL